MSEAPCQCGHNEAAHDGEGHCFGIPSHTHPCTCTYFDPLMDAPPPTREPIRLTDEAEAEALREVAHAAWREWILSPEGRAEIPDQPQVSHQEAFIAGFRAARLAGGPTLADATSDLESEIAALLGRTFTYSDPSIYVDYDVPGDTFRIGDVRFSTKALAAVLIAHMADARTPESEDTE